METWYDKNVLPSKMIFQLYDPSLVLLKDFFFLSFQLSPLPLNKLNVFFLTELIPSCLVAAGFHYTTIALVGHLIKLHQLCFSGCTLLPSLIPIVPEMRESGKFIAPITSTWFQYKPSQKSHFQHSLWKYCIISPICERIDKILITTNSFTLTKILDESISLELFIWIWS